MTILNVLLDENGSIRFDTQSCLDIMKEEKSEIDDKESRQEYEGALSDLINNINSYLTNVGDNICMSPRKKVADDLQFRLGVFKEADSENNLIRLGFICEGVEQDIKECKNIIDQVILHEKNCPNIEKLSLQQFKESCLNDNKIEGGNSKDSVTHFQPQARRNSINEERITNEDSNPSCKLGHPTLAGQIVPIASAMQGR